MAKEQNLMADITAEQVARAIKCVEHATGEPELVAALTRWHAELAAAEPVRRVARWDADLDAYALTPIHDDGALMTHAVEDAAQAIAWGYEIEGGPEPIDDSSPERLRERREALGLSRRSMADMVPHTSICMDKYATHWHPEDVRRCEEVPDAPAIYAQHRARYAAALSAAEAERAAKLDHLAYADSPAWDDGPMPKPERAPEVVDVPQPETWHARLVRLATEAQAAGKACAEAEAAFTQADADREKARLARAAAREMCHAKRQALTEATAAEFIIRDAPPGGASWAP